MGIKRIVDNSFWTDAKTDEFSPEDKYFMLYLLTSPFTKQLGIFKLSIKQAAFQMGYSEDAVKVLLERFENKYGMIRFSKETSEVAIINFLRHSVMKGGKPVEDCIKKDMEGVKNKKLIDFVFSRLQGRDGLNETVKKIVDAYLLDNDIHNDNDNDRTGNVSLTIRETEVYQTIVSYLNEKAGTKYRATTAKTRSAIHARLAEGFNVDDFKIVIDKKCADWIGTEYEKYLRPETLFGTKFEGYLNAKKTERNGTDGFNAEDSNNSAKRRIGNYI